MTDILGFKIYYDKFKMYSKVEESKYIEFPCTVQSASTVTNHDQSYFSHTRNWQFFFFCKGADSAYFTLCGPI